MANTIGQNIQGYCIIGGVQSVIPTTIKRVNEIKSVIKDHFLKRIIPKPVALINIIANKKVLLRLRTPEVLYKPYAKKKTPQKTK